MMLVEHCRRSSRMVPLATSTLPRVPGEAPAARRYAGTALPGELGPKRPRNSVHFRLFELWIEGEREDSLRQALADRQRHSTPPESLVSRMQVNRDRIVHERSDPLVG